MELFLMCSSASSESSTSSEFSSTSSEHFLGELRIFDKLRFFDKLRMFSRGGRGGAAIAAEQAQNLRQAQIHTESAEETKVRHNLLLRSALLAPPVTIRVVFPDINRFPDAGCG